MILDIATAPRRNSKRWSQETITWEEMTAWVNNPADHKECGGYFLGRLRDGVRTRASVESRSGITLDVDTPKPGFIDGLELVSPYAAIAHTTWRSTPDNPRYRMILQASRDMTPQEYPAVVTVLMHQLGQEQFDSGSADLERYMFMPSTQQPAWYQSWVLEGEPVPVDKLLAEFETLPIEERPRPPSSKNKRDPFEIEGVVGAFNRVYADLQDVIDTYDLPYEPATENRWHLIGARTEAGLVLVSDGLVYSHHINDPASHQTCSAFDLVRLHRFGEMDKDIPPQTPINRLPSHNAMLELASVDKRVVAELVGADFTADMQDIADANDWKLQMRLSSRTGRMIDSIQNWDLISANEAVFQGLQFNELTMTIETARDLPWRPMTQGGAAFTASDVTALHHHLEREYRIRPPRYLIEGLVDARARQTWVNEITSYLGSLTWDGTPRLETCLPGVKPTPYTRMVARKAMVAAVARALDPGCKWDHTLVLFGNEGLGKSWWIDKISRGHSATLGRIGDKDTLLVMQRSWIMVSDEGYSLRKADADVQKEFLTRTEDVFRLPYERESVAHRRRCVIWGTTNDEVFLRRQEGNRRFLIVRCEERVDFDSLTDEYVDQLWAEAVHLYHSGELLFLGDIESQSADQEREVYTEEDALAGLIEEHLDTLVPPEWEEKSPEARQMWYQNRADGLVPVGTTSITRTCSTQIWVEALGRRIGEHRRTDLLEINTALNRVPGWSPLPGRHRMPHYGPQLVFARTEEKS